MKKVVVSFAFFIAACVASANAGMNEMREIKPSQWEGNPVLWQARGSNLEVNGYSGFSRAKGFLRGRRLSVVADVTPRSIMTNNLFYATFGVAGFENNRRFWHFALLREPIEKGGRHRFELGMRKGDVWPAQHKEKLKQIPGANTKGTWEFGQTYRLEIHFADGRVDGIAKTKDGTEIYHVAFALKPGAVDLGAPSLHVTGGFGVSVLSARAFVADSVPDDVFANEAPVIPYGEGIRPASNDKFAATGFFRVESKETGGWRVIDPNGREIVPLGVNSVHYDGCRSRGKVRRYLEWNNAHYPNREAWEEETLARLKEWGFNRLSGGSTNLYHRGLMHSRNLNLGSRLCGTAMPQEFWICPNPGKPCAAFPNVFHPLFRQWCEHETQSLCAGSKNDRWLFGYYTDNELAWWGRGARDTGLYDEALKLPHDHTAYLALKKFVHERGCDDPEKASPELKLEFLKLVAEIYFRETTGAIRNADPNHMVLGARFAGFSGAHECVWEIAGKYCDAVTVNVYPWADLDRNVVRLNSRLDSLRVSDMFAERFAVTKKPFLVTEWSFPSLDSGLPCVHGAGQRFATQDLRTKATELFARTMLNTPSIIGYDYFMWVDEPPEGVTDAHPEDTNYGLVSEQGKPYPIAHMFKRLQNNVAGVRAQGMPAEREYNADAEKKCAPTAGMIMAEFKNVAATDGGIVVPEPKAGKGPVFKGIACANGGELGDFYMMISYMTQDEKRAWSSAMRTKSVTKKGENFFNVVCEGFVGKTMKFEITLDVKVFAKAGSFVADVVSVKNAGTVPIDLRAVYFCVRSPFASQSAGNVKKVPNMWKRPCVTHWQADDGRRIGARSVAAAASRFNYRFDTVRGTQHPDAMFEPAAPIVLKQGDEYRPDGTMWCVIEGGAGK